MTTLCADFYGQRGWDVLESLRRETIKEREYWIAQKATVGKFAKEEERLWMRRYRAVCLIFGYVFETDAPKDCKPPTRITNWDNKQCGNFDWPVDLKNELTWVRQTGLARYD